MHWGLPSLQRWLVLVEVKIDINTSGVSPFLKLDRHDPKHSRINYSISMMHALA
jgi:hypothetical protein